MRPKALQFGAGKIGRGFLGQLFFESGYEAVFVDVDAYLVDELNRRGSYPIRIVGDTPRDINVHGVRAVNGADTHAVVEEISTADIAATAVGVKALPAVAEPLARGLEARFQLADRPPLDIIVCENMVNAADFLKGKVGENLSALDKDLLETKVGFVDASIGRMVPLMTVEQREEDPLLVLVEEYCDLPVEKAAFKGPIPPIHHLEPYDNFQAYVERKLYIHNTGHAIAAYLGYLHGHTFIWEAMGDRRVRDRVKAAVDESRDALVKRRGMNRADLDDHIDDLLRRFANLALGDTVFRVARDPIRKLGKDDRLVGAARAALSAGISPAHTAFGIAAAIFYDEPSDPEAVRLKQLRENEGVEAVLAKSCELTPDDELHETVMQAVVTLRETGWVR
jgi:mannitol-1-phosphate 5-dehydrogenase